MDRWRTEICRVYSSRCDFVQPPSYSSADYFFFRSGLGSSTPGKKISGHTAPTASFHPRRSPPLASQVIPGQTCRANSSLYYSTSPDDSTEPPPAPIHTIDRQSILHQIPPRQDGSPCQFDPLHHDPNQIPLDLARPQFTSPGPFEMTPDSSGQAYSSAGTWGVAYAGGARSGPVSKSTRNEDCDTSELHRRGSVGHDSTQRITIQQLSPKLEVQRTDSPTHSSSLCDHHTSYKPGDRELLPAQAAALSSSPPTSRQNVPCTKRLCSTPHSVSRIPDKPLPVQEEFEEHGVVYGRNDNQGQERERWTIGSGEDRPPAHGYELPVRDSGREHPAASPLAASSDSVASYDDCYPHSPMASHSGPDAPTAPTPHTHTPSPHPSPSPITSGMSHANGKKHVLPPHVPVSRVDSPYPYPFRHIRHGSYTISANETTGILEMGPNVVREQRVQRLQADELNNGGIVSDSTLSPSPTPPPGPQYNPWTFLHASGALTGRHGGNPNSQSSTRSSPSHQPIQLPPFIGRYRRRQHRKRSQYLRPQSKIRPPPRVESTQPRDTSPELLSDEETPDESKAGVSHHSAPRHARWDECADDGDEADADADDGGWIDEDVGTEGGAADNLLQLEFHPDYINDRKKRRRRSNRLWEAIFRAVSTLVSFAS